MSLTDSIRKHLKARGLSDRRVSILTKVPRATVAAFLNEGKGVTSTTLDKFAAFLGLDFPPPKEPPKKSKPAK